MTELAKLIERVEAATGPDRELDGDIGKLLYNPGGPHFSQPTFTASIDAALGLVERVLPDFSLRLFVHPTAAYADLYQLGDVTHFPGGEVERRITTPYYEGNFIQQKVPALAILLALLRALSARSP